MTTTMSTPTNDAVAFWNERFKQASLRTIDRETYRRNAGPVMATMFDRLGDVDDKRVLEIGCGDGELSVYLARCGARVTAIDNAVQGTRTTAALAQHNAVADRVDARTLDAMNLQSLGEEFDLVTGKFILHHIEPFDQFTDRLATVLKPGGRGVFLENNARNPLLMFARRHLAGRFGIPKYGDTDEYPFEPRELDMLRARFASADAEFPQLMFLSKLNTYLFRHKKLFRPACRTLTTLDQALYHLLPPLRKYSYQQVVLLTKQP